MINTSVDLPIPEPEPERIPEGLPPLPAIPVLPESPNARKWMLRAILVSVSGYWEDAAQAAETEDDLWSRYLPILQACKDVISYAPLHPNEAKQLSSTRRLDKALSRLATALKEALFQGDLGELEGWVVDEAVLERRRSFGLNRYTRAKQKARRKAGKR